MKCLSRAVQWGSSSLTLELATWRDGSSISIASLQVWRLFDGEKPETDEFDLPRLAEPSFKRETIGTIYNMAHDTCKPRMPGSGSGSRSRSACVAEDVWQDLV